MPADYCFEPGRVTAEGSNESVLSDKQLLVSHGLLPGEET